MKNSPSAGRWPSPVRADRCGCHASSGSCSPKPMVTGHTAERRAGRSDVALTASLSMVGGSCHAFFVERSSALRGRHFGRRPGDPGDLRASVLHGGQLRARAATLAEIAQPLRCDHRPPATRTWWRSMTAWFSLRLCQCLPDTAAYRYTRRGFGVRLGGRNRPRHRPGNCSADWSQNASAVATADAAVIAGLGNAASIELHGACGFASQRHAAVDRLSVRPLGDS